MTSKRHTSQNNSKFVANFEPNLLIAKTTTNYLLVFVFLWLIVQIITYKDLCISPLTLIAEKPTNYN